LWANAGTQFRMGMAGPIGLDYLALGRVAEWMDIKIDETIFRKIRALEADYLNQYYGDKNSPKTKSCSHPAACSMCQKKCEARVSMQ
jgi:hypothetical protein